MVDHGTRDHATWSASATARNWQCAGALTLAQFAPPDKESIHAARGTAAHQISEKCLRSGQDASDFLGTVESTKEFQIEIDEELVNSAQMYVDYCRRRMKEYKDATGDDAIFWIEERFSLAALGTPFDAGGTGDFVMYFPKWALLEVVDLKNGMGVVEVKGNPQGRTYGLGAVLEHDDIAVDEIMVTIVQPRAQHKDGRIRSETFHVADLIAWTADLLKAMGRSKQAMDEYRRVTGPLICSACNEPQFRTDSGWTCKNGHGGADSLPRPMMDDWADTWLKPGKCTFCPAEATCPALRKQALAVAATYFEPDTGEAKIGNLPTEMSPEKLGETLDLLPMLEDFVKAVRAYAHAQAENGLKIPTPDGEEYHLVDKVGLRKWKDDETATAVSLLSLARKHDIAITEDDIFDRKLKSPAQIDKTFGTKKKALVEDLWEKPITGSNLVRSDKTTRPATKSKVETFFEQQN